MKIITENVAYIQKNDIVYLNQSDLEIPASIYMRVFGNGAVYINDSNRYEFIEFDTPEEIEFFKSIDWMIDYNEVKDLSEEEILALGQSIAEEKNNIAKRFNAMSPDEKQENEDLVSQCELLDFKMYSLRDVFWLKQGTIKMELPKGVDLPTGFVPKKVIKPNKKKK